MILVELTPTGLTINCLCSSLNLSVSAAVVPTPTTTFGFTVREIESLSCNPWDEPVLTVVTILSTSPVT